MGVVKFINLPSGGWFGGPTGDKAATGRSEVFTCQTASRFSWLIPSQRNRKSHIKSLSRIVAEITLREGYFVTGEMKVKF
jgi:hypothetical protein